MINFKLIETATKLNKANLQLLDWSHGVAGINKLAAKIRKSIIL